MKTRPSKFDPVDCPAHLSPDSAAWWRYVWETFDLDPGQAPLLQAALEARDRAAAAREAIEAEGVLIRDRWQQAKPNPALAVERDALGLMVRAWRALGLGAEPPRPIGRPATVNGVR